MGSAAHGDLAVNARHVLTLVAGLLLLAAAGCGQSGAGGLQGEGQTAAWEPIVERQADRVMGITFSADGRFAKFLASEGVLEVWDLRTRGRVLYEGQVTHAAWLADGKILWAVKADSYIYFVPAKARRRTVPVVEEQIVCHGGRGWAVTRDPDGLMVLWNLLEGRRAGVLRQPKGLASAIATRRSSGKLVPDVQITSEPARVAARYEDGTVALWSVDSPDRPICLKPHVRQTYQLVLSRDGSRALTRGRHRGMTWDAQTGRLLAELGPEPTYRIVHPHIGPPRRVGIWSEECKFAEAAFSADGKRVVTIGSSVRLWETDTGRRLSHLEPEALRDAKGIQEMKLAPDGKTLCLSEGHLGQPGRIWFWDLATGELRAEVRADRWLCDDLSRPTRLIVFRNGHAEIRAADGGRLLTRLRGVEARGAPMWRDDDKRLLLTDFQNRRVSLWDLETARRLGRYDGQACGWGKEHFVLWRVSGVGTGTMALVRWDTGRQCASLSHSGSPGSPWAWVQAAARVVTTSTEGAVQLWDFAGRRLLTEFRAHDGPVAEVRLAPDLRTIATRGADDGKMRLWQRRAASQ